MQHVLIGQSVHALELGDMLITAGTMGKRKRKKATTTTEQKQNEKQKQNAITTKTFELETGTRNRDKIIGRQEVSAIC